MKEQPIDGRLRDCRAVRVAVTLEQCWHRVPGGTATAAIEVVRALQSRHDVELVGVSARHLRLPPDPWRPPIPTRPLPLPRVALYELWHRRRWPPVQRATGPVDVIHATGVALPPRTAPLVVTVHDLAYLHDPSHFTRHGLKFFQRALDLAKRDADIVLCSSTATERDCRAAGFDPARLRVVPLGVRAEPAAPASVTDVLGRLGLKRYVLWVGTIEPRKNLPTLVAAFRRLDRSDVDLVLVGPEGWNEQVGAHTDGIDDRVRVLGFLPPRDLAALYAGAAVFCLPSIREGFGLPVLEAMAQGTPVVTSRGTSTEEVAGTAGIVVDPLDAAAIAAALESVLDDDDLAARLSAAGRARAAEFTWERTAAATAEAYADAAQ
jgi:glycosyltransferase involved in cell wall biosynthesis